MLITRIADTLIFVTLFTTLALAYHPKKSWQHTLIWTAVCCILGQAGILLEEFLDWNTLALYILNFLLWGCVFSLTAVRGKFLEKAVTVSVFCTSVFSLSDLAMLLEIVLIGPTSGEYWRLLYIPGFVMVGLFLWRFAIYTTREIPKFYLIGILSIALLVLASYYAFMKSPGQTFSIEKALPKALFSAFQLVLLYLVYYVFSVFIRYYEKDVNNVAVITRTHAEENLIRETVRLNEELRVQRHEMNHHLTLLSTLVSGGKYDQAQRLLGKLTHKAPSECDCVSSGNIIADAILNQFLAHAKEQNIVCNMDVCLDQEISIQDIDFSSLLSNLLSNALEASAQVDDPQVDIHIYPTLRYLCFNVRNRADIEQLKRNPDFQTTKRNPTAHGFGLKMIRQIAEKYDGRASFQIDDDGFFSSKVMLLMTKTDVPSQ